MGEKVLAFMSALNSDYSKTFRKVSHSLAHWEPNTLSQFCKIDLLIILRFIVSSVHLELLCHSEKVHKGVFLKWAATTERRHLNASDRTKLVVKISFMWFNKAGSNKTWVSLKQVLIVLEACDNIMLKIVCYIVQASDIW